MIRGLLQSITESAGKVRRFIASGRVREIIKNGSFYQHYGFASEPPDNAKMIIDGNSGNEISIAEDVPSMRPQLKSIDGACALFYDTDHYVLMKNDGSVVVKSDKTITIEGTDIRFGTDSELLLKRIVDDRIISIFNAHIHADPVSGFSGVPTVLITDDSLVTLSTARGK
jgi:phage gp45-like